MSRSQVRKRLSQSKKAAADGSHSPELVCRSWTWVGGAGWYCQVRSQGKGIETSFNIKSVSKGGEGVLEGVVGILIVLNYFVKNCCIEQCRNSAADLKAFLEKKLKFGWTKCKGMPDMKFVKCFHQLLLEALVTNSMCWRKVQEEQSQPLLSPKSGKTLSRADIAEQKFEAPKIFHFRVVVVFLLLCLEISHDILF